MDKEARRTYWKALIIQSAVGLVVFTLLYQLTYWWMPQMFYRWACWLTGNC